MSKSNAEAKRCDQKTLSDLREILCFFPEVSVMLKTVLDCTVLELPFTYAVWRPGSGIKKELCY